MVIAQVHILFNPNAYVFVFLLLFHWHNTKRYSRIKKSTLAIAIHPIGINALFQGFFSVYAFIYYLH